MPHWKDCKTSPDFRLVNSLDVLIKDLEAVMTPAAVTDQEPFEMALVDEAITDIEEETANEEIASVAIESPEDATSAIEALEAELSRPPKCCKLIFSAFSIQSLLIAQCNSTARISFF